MLGGHTPTKVHSHRAACWLARTALEDIVRDLLARKGLDPGGASMRTLLGCLEVAYSEDDPTVAATADYAWTRLSSASHQHAYELSPTFSEAEHLLTLVRGLVPERLILP